VPSYFSSPLRLLNNFGVTLKSRYRGGLCHHSLSFFSLLFSATGSTIAAVAAFCFDSTSRQWQAVIFFLSFPTFEQLLRLGVK